MNTIKGPAKVDLCNIKRSDAPTLGARLARRADTFCKLVQMNLPDAPPEVVLVEQRKLVMDAVSDLLSIRGVNEH